MLSILKELRISDVYCWKLTMNTIDIIILQFSFLILKVEEGQIFK
jgi:hypothetical protein